MLNMVILIGRLTRDPELRYTPNGHPVASFTVAVDRPFRGQNGEKQTDFIDVVTWRKIAEQVTQSLGKGRMVAVEGRLQIRSYDDRNGVRRKASEIVANLVKFLDGPKQAVDEAGGGAEVTEIPAEEPEVAAAGAGDDGDVPF